MARNGAEAYERDLLTWQTVETCQGCGWVVRWPGSPKETNVGCGKCGADMKVEQVRVREDAEVTLIMEFRDEWPDSVCTNCGTRGHHHVRLRAQGDGGHFLHCRRCGDELMEVDIERLRKTRQGKPAADGN